VKNKKQLLELRKYMSKDDQRELESLVNNKTVTFKNAKIFANNAITARQVVENKWRPSVHKDMEYLEYADQLNDEELLFAKKFYNEMYANRIYVPPENRLLQSDEMIKESNRINNNRNRDLFEVKQTRGQLNDIDSIDYDTPLTEMEDGVDVISVLEAFGYEYAVEFLIDTCLKQLEEKDLDKRLTLVRYYVNMVKIKKEIGTVRMREILKERSNG